MADNNKLMHAVEEELQNLTGEIYLKLEERFNALLAQAQENTESADISKQPEYIKIEKGLANAYQQIEKLNERIELKEEQVTALNHENVELKSQVADREASEQQSTQESKTHQQATEQLNQQISELNEALKQSQKEHLQLSTEFDDFQKSATLDLSQREQAELSLQEELTNLTSQLQLSEKQHLNDQQAVHEQLEKQVEKLQQTETHLQNELCLAEQALAQQHVEFNQQLEENQTSQQSAEDCINELRTTLERKEQALEALQASLTNEQANLAQLAQDNQILSTQLEDRSEQLSSFQLSVSEYQTALEAHQEIQDQQQKSISELSKYNQQKEQAIVALQADIAEQQSLGETLRVDKQELLESLEAANERHESVQQQLTDSLSLIEDKEQALKALQEKADSYEKTIASHQETQNQQTQTIETLTQDIKQKDVTTLEADKKISQLEGELGAKQNALAESNAHTEKLNHQLSELAKVYEESEQKNTQLVADGESLDKLNQSLKREFEQLTEDVKIQKEKALARREKEEADYEKARETIKYLRDENFKLSEKLSTSTAELEEKLQEYRLRFEYAQKQLAKQT